jgi:hypothetical protein
LKGSEKADIEGLQGTAERRAELFETSIPKEEETS